MAHRSRRACEWAGHLLPSAAKLWRQGNCASCLAPRLVNAGLIRIAIKPDRFSLKEVNARLSELAALGVAAMKARVEVVSLNTDGEEQRRQILTIERKRHAEDHCSG